MPPKPQKDKMEERDLKVENLFLTQQITSTQHEIMKYRSMVDASKDNMKLYKRRIEEVNEELNSEFQHSDSVQSDITKQFDKMSNEFSQIIGNLTNQVGEMKRRLEEKRTEIVEMERRKGEEIQSLDEKIQNLNTQSNIMLLEFGDILISELETLNRRLDITNTNESEAELLNRVASFSLNSVI